MALHGVASVTIGVPDVDAVGRYYEEFGLTPTGHGCFATTDGGAQLRLVRASRRRLLEAAFRADDADDIARIDVSLRGLGFTPVLGDDWVSATEPATGVTVHVVISPRLQQIPAAAVTYNGPGRIVRLAERSPAVLRQNRVRVRRLGHFVLGSPDYATSFSFFHQGLGFKVSDHVRDVGAFLRCSSDHHNVLVQRAPVAFLHHTSWQVDDIDEIGRGATHMLEGHPERHVWGLGRHHAGSNFFWYLKDPSGTFSEYHSDMDSIPEDALWTPETLDGARGLFSWGPPPPPSFINPEDLAELMIADHAPSR
jgi:hypothetical protein